MIFLGRSLAPYAGDRDNPLLSFFASITGNGTWWPMIPFLAMAAVLYFVGVRSRSAGK